ncbi:OmpA family protein [Actibacterium pelagium]|uniref:OmpA-like domain-containing protein n=1 Tax=Actibacterium pelagium TaxID=2029103 RepID=A0A917AIA4_9RHOB|nr:OmpA family protein [Actibacterium pelagium]GGE54137.1 hypothetical protein GCM10011517_22180 [Actibacterium pelagium]
MMRLRRCFAVFGGMIWVATPVHAQALTEADCKEILVQYGVVAPGCSPAPVTVAAVVLPPKLPAPAASTAAFAPQPAGPLTDRLRESHIFFSEGGVSLRAEAQLQLQKLARVLETEPLADACLKLVGHSDSVGAEAANLILSRQRAQAVGRYLATHLQDPARIEQMVGLGEGQPLPGLATTARENRRVEILARQCPAS